MSLVSFDEAAGTVSHRCEACHYVDTLKLDPAAGDLLVTDDRDTLVTRPCPHCARVGVSTVECFFLHPPSWEAGEGPHPGSLLGMVDPKTGGVVIEHTEGYHLLAHSVHQKSMIRAMQRHPHLAPHAPLRPDPLMVRGGRPPRWDGSWRPGALETAAIETKSPPAPALEH